MVPTDFESLLDSHPRIVYKVMRGLFRLTHHNLPPMVAAVPQVVEYNIGHSIIARAIFVGLDQAVRDLLQIIRSGD